MNISFKSTYFVPTSNFVDIDALERSNPKKAADMRTKMFEDAKQYTKAIDQFLDSSKNNGFAKGKKGMTGMFLFVQDKVDEVFELFSKAMGVTVYKEISTGEFPTNN